MRRFQVTVNGNIYEVEVEELQGGQAAASVASTPVAAPAPAAPAPKAETAKPAPQQVTGGAQGEHKVNSPMPGTILDIVVNIGDTLEEGDPLHFRSYENGKRNSSNS